MSKYTHLFSNAIAPEEVAWRETNDGFRKQDNSSLAGGSSTKKGATTKNGIRNGKEIAKVRIFFSKWQQALIGNLDAEHRIWSS
jgi:hypothetical protein